MLYRKIYCCIRYVLLFHICSIGLSSYRCCNNLTLIICYDNLNPIVIIGHDWLFPPLLLLWYIHSFFDWHWPPLYPLSHILFVFPCVLFVFTGVYLCLTCVCTWVRLVLTRILLVSTGVHLCLSMLTSILTRVLHLA